MSATVAVRGRTLLYPQGGGHLWVYLNWALGLRSLGCRVIWLEEVPDGASAAALDGWVAELRARLRPHGFGDALALCTAGGEDIPRGGWLGTDALGEADLLVDVGYSRPAVVSRFRRSAMIDIDPGLLQLWMAAGHMSMATYDVYFSIGETVGTPDAPFPDCGIEWHYVPPPVFLPEWPVVPPAEGRYTTVCHWWAGRWIELDGELFNNQKRASFAEYMELPRETPVRLELALDIAADDPDYVPLRERGWDVRAAAALAGTPSDYRAYIQRSRGEFSCAKPSCMRLRNAWISDRTICYLASGKPAVVQHTGPSRYLPDADGLFRFSTPREARDALAEVEADYDRHSQAARALAEEHFDATKVARRVLEVALG